MDDQDRRTPLSEHYLRTHTIGELRPLSAPILLVAYDPTWPDRFQHEAERIRRALGEQALRIEHVGSTSVPGLPSRLSTSFSSWPTRPRKRSTSRR